MHPVSGYIAEDDTVDVQYLIDQLRTRHRWLRCHLPKLQAEYEKLSVTLQVVEKATALLGRKDATDVPGLFDALANEIGLRPATTVPCGQEGQPGRQGEGHRVPLAERRESLVAYLRRKGAASRAEILEATKMPPGSLGVLLTHGAKEGWLSRTESGLWRAA
jgi:hypothetical protein